jgi:hypothetical protein
MITFVMLARQIILLSTLPAKLTPLLRYSCRLFVALKDVNFFGIKQIHTLSQERPGWGVPLRSLGGLCACPSGRRASALSLLFVFFALCFQGVTNCFSGNSFPFTNICVALCVFPLRTKIEQSTAAFPNQESSRRSSAFSAPARRRQVSALSFSSDFPRCSNLSTFNCRLSTALPLS